MGSTGLYLYVSQAVSNKHGSTSLYVYITGCLNKHGSTGLHMHIYITRCPNKHGTYCDINMGSTGLYLYLSQGVPINMDPQVCMFIS